MPGSRLKVVYIAHPLGSGPDRESNRQNAARWCVWALREKGVSPIADWITLSGLLPETPENRRLGLLADCAAVCVVDEVWLVGGRVSPGMQCEADIARMVGKPVIDLTHLGYEPPTLPGRPHHLDGLDGPLCGCGRPATHQSGWCGTRCSVVEGISGG